MKRVRYTMPHEKIYELPTPQRNYRGVIFLLAVLASGAIMVMLGYAAAGFIGWAGQ